MKVKVRIIKGIILSLYFSLFTSSYASISKIPEAFNQYKYNSPYEISYDDLDMLLKASVLVTGKSNRIKAKKSQPKVGTRLKVNIKRLTALEGNRFYFEAFKEDKHKKLLHDIKLSLEKVPDEAPLKNFSKKEQLAYWLNLYTVSILNEIVNVYPMRKLDDLLEGKQSILNKDIVTVSGIKLSLNDISQTILKEKYKGDPLIIYGLYQGIIGGPNIRKHAYTGKNVYSALESNANEFINSNRGTYVDRKKVFRVSSLYERNKDYFPNFKEDLKQHLLTYLDRSTRMGLESAKKFRVNIDDWTITDIYGTKRSFGGSAAINNAALLDSVKSPGGKTAGTAGIGAANLSLATEFFAEKSVSFGRFSPEQIEQLKALNDMRVNHSGSVTVTDLEKESNN